MGLGRDSGVRRAVKPEAWNAEFGMGNAEEGVVIGLLVIGGEA